jgi:hypothetical protein
LLLGLDAGEQREWIMIFGTGVGAKMKSLFISKLVVVICKNFGQP